MNLSTARKHAEKIITALAPYCEQIEIAGSTRRERPVINDIDLVILPRNIQAIKERCRKTDPDILVNGNTNFSFQLQNKLQVDIYFARAADEDLFGKNPCNFGSLLVCRTGSKAFNAWLALKAKKKGLHWNPYYGVCRDGNAIAAETEQEIFSCLGLDFIPPEQREK